MSRRTMWHRHPGVRTGDELTAGERAADAMRNGLGSWTFVAGFLTAMAVWMFANSVLHLGGGHDDGFDPYPYILLNLLLSMIAGLQGAVLLIAAKRADQIASELAAHTYRNTEELQQLARHNAERLDALWRRTGGGAPETRRRTGAQD